MAIKSASLGQLHPGALKARNLCKVGSQLYYEVPICSLERLCEICGGSRDARNLLEEDIHPREAASLPLIFAKWRGDPSFPIHCSRHPLQWQ